MSVSEKIKMIKEIEILDKEYIREITNARNAAVERDNENRAKLQRELKSITEKWMKDKVSLATKFLIGESNE